MNFSLGDRVYRFENGRGLPGQAFIIQLLKLSWVYSRGFNLRSSDSLLCHTSICLIHFLDDLKVEYFQGI